MTNKGTKFEKQATEYLKSLGYTIYGNNIRVNRREVDIVAIDTINNITILVEVKYRKNFFPQISQNQQRNLMEIGLLLQAVDCSLPVMWQIDFIVFYHNQLHHFKNILLYDHNHEYNLI